MRDIVRVRYILPEREDFAKVWPVLQKWLGEVKPAATMVVAGLMERGMKIGKLIPESGKLGARGAVGRSRRGGLGIMVERRLLTRLVEVEVTARKGSGGGEVETVMI